MMTIEFEGATMDVPVYRWIDGSESTVISDRRTMEKVPIMSMPDVGEKVGQPLRNLGEEIRFERPISRTKANTIPGVAMDNFSIKVFTVDHKGDSFPRNSVLIIGIVVASALSLALMMFRKR